MNEGENGNVRDVRRGEKWRQKREGNKNMEGGNV